ncbi:hypothetical protein CTI12_AA128000 [Artemisia annua]|uniref:Uncharacterized protein n=1 Tax=Artemisia annua TaxID=35608 RepID=A0A2U1PPG0_ARTAN|nr:hypothetical protein CTI12_AA128000 [Artemisia annua]
MAKEMDIDAPEPIKWITPRMNNMKVHWLERNNHMLYGLYQNVNWDSENNDLMLTLQWRKNYGSFEIGDQIHKIQVEGLLMDIAIAEEDITRRKATTQQEAIQGRAVEQRYVAQLDLHNTGFCELTIFDCFFFVLVMLDTEKTGVTPIPSDLYNRIHEHTIIEY